MAEVYVKPVDLAATSQLPGKGEDSGAWAIALPAGVTAPPKAAVVTLGAAVNAAATTMTITAIDLGAGGVIGKGNYLRFVDGDGQERLVQVNAEVANGDTTITIVPAVEAIASGATAQWPPYVLHRTNKDTSKSTALDSFSTHDTGGNRSGTAGERAVDATLNGVDTFYNAGLRNLEYAEQAKLAAYVRIQDPAPKTGMVGRILEGPAHVASLANARPVGNITADISLNFLGNPTEIAAAAAA